MFYLSTFGQQGRFLKIYISDTPFNSDGTPRQGQLIAPVAFDGRDMQGRSWEDIVKVAIMSLHNASLSVVDKRTEITKSG